VVPSPFITLNLKNPEPRKASLQSSNLWQHFNVLKLHENMRIARLQGRDRQEAQWFAEWLKTLGEGRLLLHNVPGVGDGLIEITEKLLCPTQDVNDLISIVYEGVN
jgi:hypothetical protein